MSNIMTEIKIPFILTGPFIFQERISLQRLEIHKVYVIRCSVYFFMESGMKFFEMGKLM